MRAFPLRFAPLALLLLIGLFANGSFASGQEAVRARPIERAPGVTTYPPIHFDVHPITPLTPTVPLAPQIENTPCCGVTTAGQETSAGGGEAAETIASPADNDRLAESIVDTMMSELPVAAKQRSAE
jgi:hypothetical protein